MRSDRLMDSELWDGKAPGTETNPDWAWPASSSGSAWPQANTLSQPAASWAEPGPAPVAQPDWFGPHQTRPWENLDPAAPWPVVFGPASRVLWASLSDRITALVIDAVIAGAGFGLVAVVEGIYGPGTDQTTSAALAWVLFVAFYQPLCWWTFRGTIGQRLRHLEVVRAKDGRRLGLFGMLVRYVVCVAFVGALAGLVVATVGTLMLLRPVARPVAARLAGEDDPRGRALWDRAADSLVVKHI